MLVDVSHVVEDGMLTYRGLPAPLICDFLSREKSRTLYAAGTEFCIGKIEMVANTGTYLDSPFHRYAYGKDIAELALERLANLEGVIIPADLSNSRAISRNAFQGHDLRGKAALVRTGWDAHWRTDQYFEGHPFLTRDAAEHPIQAGAALVGIDSLNQLGVVSAKPENSLRSSLVCSSCRAVLFFHGVVRRPVSSLRR